MLLLLSQRSSPTTEKSLFLSFRSGPGDFQPPHLVYPTSIYLNAILSVLLQGFNLNSAFQLVILCIKNTFLSLIHLNDHF